MCENMLTKKIITLLVGVNLMSYGNCLAASLSLNQIFPGQKIKNINGLFVSPLELKDSELKKYGIPKTRADKDLYRVLLNRGISKRNLSLLENNYATSLAIKAVLRKKMLASHQGEIFLFYFSGHGWAEKGTVYLVPYDFKDSEPEINGITKNYLIEEFAGHFKGKEIILFGDFCNSGVLVEIAKEIQRKNPRIMASALASADRWSYSTGEWTFTKTLERIFEGDPILDANKDGALSFREAQDAIMAIMRFEEYQLAGTGISLGFNDEEILAKVKNKKPSSGKQTKFSIGEYVEIKLEPNWLRAKIKDYQSGIYHLVMIVDHREIRATENELRLPLDLAVMPNGTILEANWDDRYVNVEVVDRKNDFYLVSYEEPLQDWNEWISAAKLIEGHQ
ncbi:MAG: hypothetical protein FJ116_07580 [Deltaproteobacteria bacterium]|nr:hypothetical protein [Deltaproteobacteria bacterium]